MENFCDKHDEEKKAWWGDDIIFCSSCHAEWVAEECITQELHAPLMDHQSCNSDPRTGCEHMTRTDGVWEPK